VEIVEGKGGLVVLLVEVLIRLLVLIVMAMVGFNVIDVEEADLRGFTPITE